LARSNHQHLEVEKIRSVNRRDQFESELAGLLNLSPDVDLVAADTALNTVDIASEQALLAQRETVYDNRPDIKAANLELLSIQEARKTVSSGHWLPELRVGAYTSVFGDVFTPLYPTSAVNGSLLWHLPLGQAVYGGQVKKYDARIAIQETEIAILKNRTNTEMAVAGKKMKNARDEMALAEDGRSMATKALSQGFERQRLGTVRPFELLQMQEVYIQSQMDYLRAIANYNKAQYALYVASGNNL
jgi:outer membrane protein TolC